MIDPLLAVFQRAVLPHVRLQGVVGEVGGGGRPDSRVLDELARNPETGWRVDATSDPDQVGTPIDRCFVVATRYLQPI